MVKFKEIDFNLPKIRRESKLFNLVTRFTYRVYGLKVVEGNPAIQLTLPDNDNGNTAVDATPLEKFFKDNKIEFDVDENGEFGNVIRIGLRRDLREHIVLCSCILQTIVYVCEKRIELDETYLIPGIPKLVVPVKPEKPVVAEDPKVEPTIRRLEYITNSTNNV